MQSIKNDFSGGLNLDDSFYKIRENQYCDALNITKDAVQGNSNLVITNIQGNRIVDYDLPAGRNKCIGAYAHTLRNTVIYMVWNENRYDLILEHNRTTGVTVPILSNLTDSDDVDVTGFTEHDKITSINVCPRELEGDLLYYIDSLGRPSGLNIDRYKAGEYTPITRDFLDVAKKPPLSPPVNVFASDPTRRSNNLRNKLFRFKYRWVYDDFEKSTTSPISAIALPANILSDAFTSIITNNNTINIGINSGGKDVAKIELLMSYVEKSNTWSDFALVESIDSPGDNTVFNYSFYNDGVYPIIDINESIQPFDNVPELANAQELANGNVLTYWGITEGIDRDLEAEVEIVINTTPAGNGGSTGSLNVVITNSPFFGFQKRGTFSGIPPVGTIINVRIQNNSTSLISTAVTHTTISGSTSATVAAALQPGVVGQVVISNTSPSVVDMAIDSDFTFYDIEIILPATSASTNSIATFPFSTERRIGLTYFDQKGKTNGVLYSTQAVFPAYSENVGQQVLIPYINAKIYHVPPIWAYSYQWVLTKENTNYLYLMTAAVNKTETNFLYFDISNLPLNQKKFPSTTEVISYTFQDGDRLRLIRNDTTDVVFNDTYDAAIEGVVVDPKINGITTLGTFIKIKKVAPFTDALFTSNFFVIQVYRPAQQLAGDDNQVYFEFGEQYNIINPTLSTRYHAGQVTDQNIAGNIPAEFNFYNGDAYFRTRTMVTSETGSTVFNILDRNFVDTYISAVNNIDGRPSLIDENARRAYYSTMVRFGQAYQANTNINGLNRFYENNFDEYDLSAGDIMRVKVRDRYIRVFQKFKVGTVPIFNQISKNADGTQLLVVTDKLLNPIQYYSGNKGIGEHAESLASYNFADYFTTNVVGEICRLSNDGINPISVTYNINSWANEKLPLRVGNYKVYGAFDQKLNNYICALEATGSDAAATIVFDEESNTFDSFISLQPEMMTTLGTLLIAFKNGQLWTHDSETYNNFFGVQYGSSITPVFNNGAGSVKSFMAIEEKANTVWACPEIETSLMSYGSVPQQSNLVDADFDEIEGKYCSDFLKDSNSIGGINGGDQLKGDWIKIKMSKSNAANFVSLNLVSIRMIDSALNNR